MKQTDVLRKELEQAKIQAKAIIDNEKSTVDEINSISAKIDTLEAKLKLAEQQEEKEQKDRQINGRVIDKNENSQTYEKTFVNFLQGRATVDDSLTIQNALSSERDIDGGALLPKDQQTEVIELAREYSSLRELVNVESVTTMTGSRVIEEDGEYTSFAEITEGTKLADIENGKFKVISYNCKTLGGILPIPNNLMNDSKNLLNHISKWFAKKKVATENKLIVDLLNTAPKIAINGLDDIKTVLNVTLDPAISENAVIVTNQTGFNELDKMKDEKGNYLLQSDPTQPTRKIFGGRTPVRVYPDKVLKNDTTKAPIIIGDMKRVITLFDRQAMTLDSTNVGAGGFETNSTMMRALMRMDVKKFDEKAFVYCQLDTATVPKA